MPSLESLAPVLGSPESGDYTLLSAGVAVRQNRIVHMYKVQNLVQWMFGAWATPYLNTSDIDAFRRVIHMSQLAQSGCLRAEAEHYRRGRDSPAATGGSLYWMLNDNWPAPSWTSLEYGGRQKLLHFEASRMFSTIAVSTYCTPSIEACTAMQLHVSSDSRESIEGATLRVSAVRWADGVEGTSTTVLSSVTIPGLGGLSASLDASGFASVLRGAACASAADCFVIARLSNASGSLMAPEVTQWVSLWKDAKLVAPAKITVTAAPVVAAAAADGGGGGSESVVVTVTSDAVSPTVMVHCGSSSDFGTFDNNGLLLLPHVSQTVVFTPRAGPPGTPPLNPCTTSADFYAVDVNGVSRT
jgi:beta-mannosidase